MIRKKPTVVLSAPFKQQYGPQNRPALMLETDIGLMSIREASVMCEIPVQTLWTRNNADDGKGWQRPGFLSKERPNKVVVAIAKPAPIAVEQDDDIDEMGDDRRSHTTIKLGTWERKVLIKSYCPVAAAKRRERQEFLDTRRQEYSSALRLNRMMAR